MFVKEKKSELREIESMYLSSEAALERSRKETEMLTQAFAGKKQKISVIELEIATKSSELEKIQHRYEQGNAELHNIERQIARIKTDLLGIEQIITSKNNEYNQADSNLRSKQSELRDLEKHLNEKRQLLERTEQEFHSIHNQAKTEEEAIYIFQEEAKSIQLKISKLNEVLKRVESQKASVLKEIEGINARVVEDEMRHRGELENLRNAVSNGESTLRQLMESVQRCRNKLASDKEESSKVQDDINRLLSDREAIEAMNRDLLNETSRLRSEMTRIKEDEDTALVLLALSGHKIDERVKQRITSLCRSATELELLKASLQETGNKEVREGISETRMKQHSRMESYENLSIFDKESRMNQESRMDEFKPDRNSFFRNG
jgi:chromosome segregation ATPase